MTDTPPPSSLPSPPSPAAVPGPSGASRIGYFAANWRMLLVVGLTLPIAGLTAFALYAPEPALWGALIGWTLGALDAALTGIFVTKSVNNPESTAGFKALAGGFMFRLAFIVLGYFALQRIEAVDGTGFALAWIATHFASIAGWAWLLQTPDVMNRPAEPSTPPK